MAKAVIKLNLHLTAGGDGIYIYEGAIPSAVFMDSLAESQGNECTFKNRGSADITLQSDVEGDEFYDSAVKGSILIKPGETVTVFAEDYWTA